jgi:hypothetical protein
MKPWIQCVLTHWKSGSTASGRGPIFMINLDQLHAAERAWSTLITREPMPGITPRPLPGG